jgi:hypothetical protein
MKHELTIDDLIERSHDEWNAALMAARYLAGWRFADRQDGVSYYWMPGGEDNVALPRWSHERCMSIIEMHRPGTLVAAFDACI